eukprot:28547_1
MSFLRIPTYVFITLSFIIYTTHSYGNDRDTHHSQISLDDFPNPLVPDNIPLCGRGHKSFICDPKQLLNGKILDEIDNILSNATESNLVWCSTITEQIEGQKPKFIANPNEKTRDNYSGLEIGIAIIDSFRRFPHDRLRRSDDIPKKCTIYGKSIHDQWGVGQAGCNNAALIFININDRYLYVSTGSGIKKLINDDFIEKFIIPKYIRPLMRAGKYGKAVKLIVESIIEILRCSDDLKNNKLYQEYMDFITPGAFLGILYETWFIIILVACGVGYLGYKFYSERDYRECERKLAQLYAQKQAKKFAGTSCPICLEEFPPVDDTENVRETAILICGHKFCKNCLDGWFNSQSATNQKCPICRHDRDDWSAVRGEQKHDEKQDEKQDDLDEKSHDDFDHGSGGTGTGTGGGSAYKSSSSDNFYDNQQSETNTNTNTNMNGGDGFGFRRRRGNRYGYGGMGMSDWMFQQEMMFRMSRMRYYYPRYVTRDMTDRWNRPGYSGSYTGDNGFRRANPNYRPPRSTGSSQSGWGSSRSSGFSFGGGSSSGGGGGGGGW